MGAIGLIGAEPSKTVFWVGCLWDLASRLQTVRDGATCRGDEGYYVDLLRQRSMQVRV